MPLRASTAAALLLATSPAIAQTTFTNPPTMSRPPGYTHVVTVAGPQKLIFVAGQLGFSADGRMAGEPGDFQAQARQSFENLRSALTAAGARFEHVVKLNMYVVDIKTNMPRLREVRDAYVNTTAPPASTTVEVSRLAVESALFEVEAIAVIPSP